MNNKPILKLKSIRLFEMNLAPMMMMERGVFHLHNYHHHLYYPLNQNILNLVLDKTNSSINIFSPYLLLRLNGEFVQSYERDDRTSKSDS